MMASDIRLLSQSSVKIKMPNAIGAAREMAVTMESCRGLRFFADAIAERHKVQGSRNKKRHKYQDRKMHFARCKMQDARYQMQDARYNTHSNLKP